MKKRLAVLLCIAMGISLLTGCTIGALSGETGSARIALIQMTPADPGWIKLEEGAMKAASELDVEVVSLSDNGEDHASASDRIREAVASGSRAIVISAGGSEEISTALQAAVDSGVTIVCVDAADDVEAAAVFNTDQKAAGKAAAEAMRQVLEARRIREGQIGIIGMNYEDSAATQREEGFREAFSDGDYVLLETQYADGDAGKAESIAADWLSQGAVGLFACDAAALAGAGRAGRESGARPIVTGCGVSEDVRNLMEDGSIRSAVIPSWDILGYEAVKAAVAVLGGETLEAVADTEVTVLQSDAPVTEISDYKIALIAKDRIDRHSVTLEEGAMKAASELGCEVINLSPNLEAEDQYLQQIHNAVSSGCHAVVAAAGDSDAVREALQEAAAAGVKVILMGPPDDSLKAAAAVLTDNRAAGKLAGELLIAALEEQELTEGSIGIIGADPDTEQYIQREAGFREAFEGKPYTLMETQYSDGDAARSHAIAEDYLGEDVLGIFCVSEGCTVGAGNAVREEDSDTLAVGFGISGILQEMVEEGWLFASVAEDDNAMGYEAVKAACAALNGENPDGTVIGIDATILTQS